MLRAHPRWAQKYPVVVVVVVAVVGAAAAAAATAVVAVVVVIVVVVAVVVVIVVVVVVVAAAAIVFLHNESVAVMSEWAMLVSRANTDVVVEVLLYVHRNCGFIRDGSPGRPPRPSHSS